MRWTSALTVLSLVLARPHDVRAAPHRRVLDDRALIDDLTYLHGALAAEIAPTNVRPPIRIATTTYAFAAPSPPPTQYVPPSVNMGEVAAHPRINSPSYARLTRMLPRILTHAVDISFNSWELGALTEAMLEVYMPGLTPFAWDSTMVDRDIPWDMLKVAQMSLLEVNWHGAPSGSSSPDSPHDLGRYLSDQTSPVPMHGQPLINGDGSLGDPCSLGMAAWVLAEYAKKNDEVRFHLGLREGRDYAWAVGNQLSHLYWSKTNANGTFSMREEHFELWADMGYMIPPFLAYLGLTTNSDFLLGAGIDQWLLESSALLDKEQNLYRHINDWDARHWATGHGWMLAGGLRVLASIRAAGKAASFADKISQVESTIAKALDAVFKKLDAENLVPNYMNQPEPRLNKGDTAGSALIVASFYRFAADSTNWTLGEDIKVKAAQAFDGIMAKLDNDGWLRQVVDPMGKNGWIVPDDPNMHSPEGQAFLGMMWAARTAAGF